MIYKTFFGKHIDLSKLVSVSDAMFMDGWFEFSPAHVRFEMEFQLLEHPLIYRRGMKDYFEFEHGSPGKYKLKTVSNTIIEVDGRNMYVEKHEDLLCVSNLQKQINEIVQEWKRFKKES
jgi:hypothetical protein